MYRRATTEVVVGPTAQEYASQAICALRAYVIENTPLAPGVLRAAARNEWRILRCALNPLVDKIKAPDVRYPPKLEDTVELIQKLPDDTGSRLFRLCALPYIVRLESGENGGHHNKIVARKAVENYFSHYEE